MSVAELVLPRRHASLVRRTAKHARRPQIAFGIIVALFWLIVILTVQWWAPHDVRARPHLARPDCA